MDWILEKGTRGVGCGIFRKATSSSSILSRITLVIHSSTPEARLTCAKIAALAARSAGINGADDIVGLAGW
jgi:hypothetical protein